MVTQYIWRRGTLLAAFAFVAGAAAIYGTRAPTSNGLGTTPGAGPVPSAAPAAKSEAPPANALAAFVRKTSPEQLPNVAFQNGAGTPLTLETFRGRVVLLNLWATWCLPCRKEMPALDRLQAALGSADFEVVALSIDRTGAAGSQKFLDSVGVKKLKLYVDPTARLGNEFKAIGLPTTLLIDRQGREIGRLIGPAEWDDGDAQRLVRDAMAAK